MALQHDGLPRIGITLGDPAGIGPEIALKAALDPEVRRICRPLLVGDQRALALHAQRCGLSPAIRSFDCPQAVEWDGDAVAILHCDHFPETLPALGEVGAENGKAALGAARSAVEAALGGWLDAVVACPQHERAIHEAGIAFDGHPSFVARCCGLNADEVFLMLCFDQTRIAHVTLHASVTQAAAQLSSERVLKAIRATARALGQLGLRSPRIGVSGLNPHAGEQGLFGAEDLERIVPAIEAARAEGLDVHGPQGADVLLGQPGYDAFVVMLHDQGHIAAKLLAPNRTAALSIGAPVLFSSVAHGTAMDIAGRDRASPAAVIEAIRRLVGAER
jgi:4-hydroxy-L-threonine phosphate dehydrogenase PdxA